MKAKAYGYACSVALCHQIRIARCFIFFHNPPYWSLLEHAAAAGSGKRAEAEGGRGSRCIIALVSRHCTRKHGAS
jgi:hypothetical protein